MNLPTCSKQPFSAKRFSKRISKLLTPQILKAMKLTFVFLTAFLLNVSAKSSAQKVTLNVKNVTLDKLFREIEKQTGYGFLYTKKMVKDAGRVTLDVKNEPVNDVLHYCFSKLPLNYTIENNTILISRKLDATHPLPDLPQALISVHGIVKDEKGNPLAGVSVIIKGTNKGTITKADGSFSIDADAGDVLEFTFVGYRNKNVTIGQSSNFNVVMEIQASLANEVVVVGYGSVKKGDLTGSVSKIGEDDINLTPIVDLTKAMQGHAAGVLVTQNSAKPGGSSTIRIRGTGSINAGNDPLYVIDGFPVSDISSLNPADIESIDVLKDASSTAIYGSRGSNGVVMITTKHGKAGKSSIGFNNYYGLQSVLHKIPLLDARQYAEFINDARINGGGSAYFDGSSSDRPLPSTLGKGTDWQNEVFRKAPMLESQLQMSGGNSKTQFFISGNIYNQEGIILNSNYNRYSLRINLDQNLSKNIDIGISMFGSREMSNSARTETDGGTGGGVTNASINYAPIFPIFNSDGSYYRNQGSLNGSLVDNPVGLAKEITDQFINTRILSNAFLKIKIFKGLSFRTSAGIDFNNSKSNYYATRKIGLGFGTNGSASVSAGLGDSWLNENTLTYTRIFKQKHTLTGLVGYSVQGTHNENVGANAINFNNDFALFNNLGTGATLQTPSSSESDWFLQSYFARINYSYSDRYLVTLTVRRDGSSRFGGNNKYGVFPSGAVAWRIINEKFMHTQKIISDFKLRLSYGVAGNQAIGDYAYLALIGSPTYPFGGPPPVLNIGGAPTVIANPDLGWERSNQLDVGVDLGFLNNKVQITADYYDKITSNLLFGINVPWSTGFQSSILNIGKVQNKGIELSIDFENINHSKFQWHSGFNISFNRNKVLKLDGRPQFTTGSGSGHLVVSNTVLLQVGQSIGNFYGQKMIGIFQNDHEVENSAQKNAKPGDLEYADINNDGIINGLDRTVIGNGNPKSFVGFNNTFNYKGFELGFFFQGSLGNDILNFGRFDLYNLNGNNNQSAEVINRWSPTNPSNSIPRANSQGGQRIFSSFQVEDGSYLRLKNISFGYDIPQKLLGRLSLSKVKIYIAAQNWITFTSYKGYDPEVSRFGTSSTSQGMDYGGYPSAKTLLVGLNVKF